MTENDELEHAVIAARAAAAVALELSASVTEELKCDGSPVSKADRAAEQAIRAHLANAFPNDAFLGEEMHDDRKRLLNQRVWIIDPIDGTRAYLNGGDDWAVQLALAINGHLNLGVLVIPARKQLYAGSIEHGAWREDAHGQRHRVHISDHSETRPSNTLLASRNAIRATAEVLTRLPELTVRRCSSVGVKVTEILAGHGDCYIHPRYLAEWDVAAPAAVLLAAGGHATTCHGDPLRFNTNDARCLGLCFSTRDDHHSLTAALHGLNLRPAHKDDE